jgi:hypothetical protein
MHLIPFAYIQRRYTIIADLASGKRVESLGSSSDVGKGQPNRESAVKALGVTQLRYSASQRCAFACGSMVRINHFVCSFSALRAEKLHTTNM